MKQETLINVQQMNMSIIKEPDAQTQGASMDSIRQMLSGLQEMFAGMQNGENMGTICIPVYVGGTLLDEADGDVY